MRKIDRTGETSVNTYGIIMKIVKYNNRDNIVVEFQDEYRAKVHAKYKDFKKGLVKNPYNPIIYDVGFIAQGKYNCKDHEKIYHYWHSMLARCYDEKQLKRHPTYIDCKVCEEWHNFQNFAKWFEENYYEVEGDVMNLDKDILKKSNKIYSPETCILVPQRINKLFVKHGALRGKYPIGVYEYKREDNYRRLAARCKMLDKNKSLGYFPLDRPFQAFTCYKNFKENYIKQVANEYKDLIPVKLYDAMYKYEVEIND
jgi:hypothetical protein